MTDKAQHLILVDGLPVERLNLRDRGFAYGDGLFETMRLENGVLPLLDAHLERLNQGCRRLHIPLNILNLRSSLLEFVSPLTQPAIIKLMVTRGSGGFGYQPPSAVDTKTTVVLQSSALSEFDENALKGVFLLECSQRVQPQPVLAGIKHLNRLDYVLAARELPVDAESQGLLLDHLDNVLETLHHNLFAVIDGQLKTPSLQNAGVHGVMRKTILEVLAPQLSLKAHVCEVTTADLLAADEVFICNSVRGIWPVRQFRNQVYSVPGSITRQLQQGVRQLFANVGHS